eukprot:TRINITY_DN851_c0_g1_i1.p1 TRINITY_DN851_c0_g1~~TRINITY_DN851_c0_g1_i1.p1  ORF type:complete len:199 (+),score=17.29 TRINITY_DN851_c0_g1_i1:69-665(+)
MGCFGAKNTPRPVQPPTVQKVVRDIPILLVGDLGVGKTSIIRRYCLDTFVDNGDDSDISASLPSQTIDFPDFVLRLLFYDTAGQEKFRSVTVTFYRTSHAILLVHDIANRNSFENLKTWLIECRKFMRTQTYLACIGTKNDLSAARAVLLADAESFASNEKLSYHECTSKEGTSVKDAFAPVVAELASWVQNGQIEFD